MDNRQASPALRTGRFLWMEEPLRKRYLDTLKKKIARGFFTSDLIVTKIADELAPVFNDHLENGGGR